MSYRKRFPKGPDWEKPKPNPFDFEGTPRIPESSYHGMEVIGYMKNNACFINKKVIYYIGYDCINSNIFRCFLASIT